jgi:translation initiation factor 3 subunit K
LQNIPLPDNEPDPLIPLLPLLRDLSTLLQTCRFPGFWKAYHSEELAPLRENYTVEYAGFDDSVREVAVQAVRATFEMIGKERLGRYLDLTGVSTLIMTLSTLELTIFHVA